MDQRTILLLGGYGKAGQGIARLLLAETNIKQIVISGRNAQKAQREAEALMAQFGEERVTWLQVDADQPAALHAAFTKVDLVVVCFAYRANRRSSFCKRFWQPAFITSTSTRMIASTKSWPS